VPGPPSPPADRPNPGNPEYEAHLRPPPDWVADLFDQPHRAEVEHAWGPFYEITYKHGGMEELGLRMAIGTRRHALAKAARGVARRNRARRRWTIG
jgi:hypothetical protein